MWIISAMKRSQFGSTRRRAWHTWYITESPKYIGQIVSRMLLTQPSAERTLSRTLGVRIDVQDLAVVARRGEIAGRPGVLEDRLPVGVPLDDALPQRQLRVLIPHQVAHVIAGREPELLERDQLGRRCGAGQACADHFH